MACCTAESKSCTDNTRSFHDSGFHHITDCKSVASDLTNCGKTCLQTFMRLLNSYNCLLLNALQYPVTVIIR